MENLPKLSSSQALRLLVSDPQGEPATIMHRKHSLGQADIHRTRTVQAFGILHKKLTTLI